jgi:hypothetical protein
LFLFFFLLSFLALGMGPPVQPAVSTSRRHLLDIIFHLIQIDEQRGRIEHLYGLTNRRIGHYKPFNFLTSHPR